MDRAVENTIDRLALKHGRVHVSAGFTDGLVRASTPNGVEHFINEDGAVAKTGINWSVDWEA